MNSSRSWEILQNGCLGDIVSAQSFVLDYLRRYRKAYIYEMFVAYNFYTPEPVKYTSFKTIVHNLKRDGYISVLFRDLEHGYPKTYYRLTKKHAKKKTHKWSW